MTPLVNVSEACRVLSELDAALLKRAGWTPPRMTPRQLKYLEEVGALPSLRTSGLDGRLYGPVEIAQARTWLHIVCAEGVRDTAGAAVLAYLREALDREFSRPSTDAVLIVHGVRGEVVSAADARKRRGIVCALPLAKMTAGVVDAMRRVRQEQPRVWTGARFEKSSTLVTEVLRAFR